jgi:hypothetical protein
VVYGESAHLELLTRSGGTRGWGTARLERLRFGHTAWTTLDDTLPNGASGRNVKPLTRADYRVVSGNATGEAKRIEVKTRVTLAAPSPPYARITGTIGPARSGVVVELERRRADGSWAALAEGHTHTGGKFVFAVSRAGKYRVGADAGAGLPPGRDTVTLPSP